MSKSTWIISPMLPMLNPGREQDMKRKRIFTYAVIGGGKLNKINMLRNDGKVVNVSRKRMAELRASGRITDGLKQGALEYDSQSW